MSEKRFVKDHSYLVNYDKYCILDKVQHKHLYLDEVCKKLNEQQDTIFKLQDLCGKSDGENAKLRIENNDLKSTITLLEYQLKVQDRIIEEYEGG